MADNAKDGGFAGQIKEFLFDGPASINDVCSKLKISWATAKSALDMMKEKGEVKEIISNPKIRIFKLTNDPAFFGVPLTKQQKNDALFLFQTIRQEWKSKKDPLLLTTLQKIAVDTAIKCKCNIPSAQFHYGRVIPVFETPTPLFEIKPPKNYVVIIDFVKEEIHNHKNYARGEMEDQYEKYGMTLYQAKQRFKDLYKKSKSRDNKDTTKEFEPALISLLMNWPTQNQDPEIFSLFLEYIKEVHGLIVTKTANDNLDKINETFNILWDLVTTGLFFRDLERQITPEKKEIFEYIRSSQILSKKENAEERINYLKLFVDSTVEIEMAMDEESLEIRRLLTEGAEED